MGETARACFILLYSIQPTVINQRESGAAEE